MFSANRIKSGKAKHDFIVFHFDIAYKNEQTCVFYVILYDTFTC